MLQSSEWLKLLTQINFLRNRNVVFICNHFNENNNSKYNEKDLLGKSYMELLQMTFSQIRFFFLKSSRLQCTWPHKHWAPTTLSHPLTAFCLLLRGFVDIDPHLQSHSKPTQRRADAESSRWVLSGTIPWLLTKLVLSVGYCFEYHSGVPS